MEKLKPRAVIFDLGSTLIEYESDSWDVLSGLCAVSAHKYLSRQKYEIPDVDRFVELFDEVKSDYRKLASDTLVEWNIPQAVEKLLKKLGLTGSDELIDKIFEAYYKPVDERLYIYDDTIETLQRVKAKGMVIGLISNTIFPESAHKGELKRFGIKKYLDFTIFSSTFGVRKPHPDIFYQACNLAGFAPPECVFIGDRHVEDWAGPTKIGMSAILKLHPGREYPSQVLESALKITSLSQLGDHLDI